MAAQKLTKARFIQLIVALILLLSLFFYRSCEYQPKTEEAPPPQNTATQ